MRKFYVTLGTALMCSTALMAQSAMDKDKSQMGKDTMAKDGMVSVTGCVAQGADMQHFKLTNATKSSMPMGTTGSDSAMKSDPAMKSDTAKAGMMMSYDLDGGDLKAHLGHKVTVSGTMDDKAMMDHDKMAKPGTMGDKDKMGSTANKDMMAGKIKVTSVKMVAASCI